MPKREWSKKLLIAVTVLVLFFVFVYLVSEQKTHDPFYLYIEEVTVSSESIVVKGFDGSAMLFNYRGYRTNYREGRLYIQYRGGWRMPWMGETNAPQYCPVENEWPDLREVYICGPLWGKPRLVWNRERGACFKNNRYS